MAENKENLISKVVRVLQSNERHSGAKTKKRGEISGGGKKPWRQKGTGRARAGSSRSPIWRGGGVVFGPTGNENYSLKVNKKERRAALEAVYAEKKNVVLTLDLPKFTKTKEAAEFLKKNEATGKALVLVAEAKDTKKESLQLKELKRVFRNIPEVRVLEGGKESVLDVLWAEKILKLTTKEPAKKVKSGEDK